MQPHPDARSPWQAPALATAFAIALAAALLTPVLADGLPHVIAKGCSVSALAVAAWCLPAARAQRAWLSAIMALGSLGDILLEVPGLFILGGASFAAGHIVAIRLYLRNAARKPGWPALALMAWGASFPALLLPAGERLLPGIYALLLCAMASAALASRFPRWLTGVGALLFVLSDTLLIMRMGGRLIGPAEIHGLAVWGSYWLAQALIFAGIARTIIPAGRLRL